MACRIVFLLFSSIILYDEAVIAVISIATGQRIGFAYRALVMAMHKNQLNVIAAKKTSCLHRLFFKKPTQPATSLHKPGYA
jgi:hypothetical protein